MYCVGHGCHGCLLSYVFSHILRRQIIAKTVESLEISVFRIKTVKIHRSK